MVEWISSVEPEWVEEDRVIAIHERQIAEHGGGVGLRDRGLLQSALARTVNAFHYNQVISLSKLAACYGFGLAKNHPFIDGNKRTAYVVTRFFLKINGYDFQATREDKYMTFLALAAGDVSEDALGIWLETRIIKLI